MIGSIPNIGDELILQLAYLEQVSTLDVTFPVAPDAPYSDVLGGITATRTVEKYYRYSQDGTTYTAWKLATSANLRAESLDANQPFYFEFKWVRTGTDATGTIDVVNFDLLYDVDPTALSGVGLIANTQIRTDMIELIPQLIRNYLIQVNGGDSFDVVYAIRSACKPSIKPVIYFNQITTAAREWVTKCEYKQVVSFILGIKDVNERRNVDRMIQQWDLITEMFNPYNFCNFRYNFEFKGFFYNYEKIGRLGITNSEVLTEIALYQDDDCLDGFEIQVNLEMNFKKN